MPSTLATCLIVRPSRHLLRSQSTSFLFDQLCTRAASTDAKAFAKQRGRPRKKPTLENAEEISTPNLAQGYSRGTLDTIARKTDASNKTQLSKKASPKSSEHTLNLRLTQNTDLDAVDQGQETQKDDHVSRKSSGTHDLIPDHHDEGGLNEAVKEWESNRIKADLRMSSGSKHHNDLPSFLEYAHIENLDSSSKVYVGTHYEYTVANVLGHHGLELTRTGRRSDLGIDLIGLWTVPSAEEPLRVFVQCKSLKSGLSPHHARELVGAFSGVPAWFGKNVLGLVASPGNVTLGVRKAIEHSAAPMGFLKISRCGTLEQFHWNRSAVEKGLRGMGSTLRYGNLPPSRDDESNTPKQEITLTWEGWPVELMASSKRAPTPVCQEADDPVAS